MNWINSRKGTWTCFAGISFAIMVLFSMSLYDVPAPTNALAPAYTPTRLYPTPILVSPTDGAIIMGEKLTNFSWQWGGALQEGQRFDLRIWRLEKPCCTVAMPRECSYRLDTPPDGFGDYLWQVAVVRVDKSGSKSTLCESLIWPFVWYEPDAVVNTEALNLRSGPGVVYDNPGLLKRGDLLKVTGRNPAGNWLKVIAPDGQEGWVACWLLRVSVDMDDVPVVETPLPPTPKGTPTPVATLTPELLPPPIPLEPENGAAFIGGPVILKWKLADDRPLGPGELFSLRMHKEGETRICHHYQPRDMEYWGDPVSYCTEGKLYWSVTLIRELCTDCPEEERWQELSEPSEEREERWIYYTPGKEPWTWPTPVSDDDDDDDGVWRP